MTMFQFIFYVLSNFVSNLYTEVYKFEEYEVYMTPFFLIYLLSLCNIYLCIIATKENSKVETSLALLS